MRTVYAIPKNTNSHQETIIERACSSVVSVANEVCQAIWPWVEEQGFRPWEGRSAFMRKRQDGFHALLISVSPYPEEWWVEVQVGIRLDLVEESAFQFTQGLQDFHPYSLTAHVPLHVLSGSAYKRFICPPNDWATLRQEVEPALHEHAWPFFEKYSQLLALEKAYNSDPRSACYLHANRFYRCFRGMVLAKATHQRQMATLGQIYADELNRHGAPEQLQVQFQQFGALLIQTSFN